MPTGRSACWISNATYRPMVLRGWNGLTTKVNSTGQVVGTCVGTGLGWDETFYFNRPTSVTAAHGYGPIFLAGADVINLLRAIPSSSSNNPNAPLEPVIEEEAPEDVL